ncbi:hypothetical protein Bbelb_278870 [Branchiostoma belcheri]|nr:hypothetical protein Bbelb_278870 [Branchiostoma belcheri]
MAASCQPGQVLQACFSQHASTVVIATRMNHAPNAATTGKTRGSSLPSPTLELALTDHHSSGVMFSVPSMTISQDELLNITQAASSSLVEATNPYLLPACYLSRPATNTDVYSASSFLQQESRHSKKRIESGKSSPPAAPLRKTHRDELGRAPAGRGQCDGHDLQIGAQTTWRPNLYSTA